MNLGLEDKAVFVTGASRGLGRAIAIAFAREGARLFLGVRRRIDEAQETISAVEEAGASAELVTLDLRDRASVTAAFEGVHDAAGGALDVLVNNAGVSRDNLFAIMSDDEWDEVIATNLTGTMSCCRLAARAMMRARQGAIVNIASVAGLHASPGQANYAASNGGLVAFTKTLAAELAPKGVRVNAIVPGLIATGMAARLDRRIAEERRRMIPLARFGDPDEVARLVCVIASEVSSYIVGQAIVVDGGLTL